MVGQPSRLAMPTPVQSKSRRLPTTRIFCICMYCNIYLNCFHCWECSSLSLGSPLFWEQFDAVESPPPVYIPHPHHFYPRPSSSSNIFVLSLNVVFSFYIPLLVMTYLFIYLQIQKPLRMVDRICEYTNHVIFMKKYFIDVRFKKF